LIFHGLFAIVYFTLWLSNREHVAGLGYWTANLILYVIGRSVTLFDASIPAQLGGVVGTLVTSIGAVLFYFGLAAFTRTAINKRFYYGFIVVLVVSIVWSIYLVENLTVRSVVSGIFVVFLTSRYLVLLWKNRNLNRWYRRPFLMLFLLYSFFTFAFIMRTVFDIAALANGELLPIFDSPRLRISRLFSLIMLTSVNFCILILTNNALLKDLANESMEKDKMVDRLKVLAERDGLTGLPNRNTLEQYLDTAIEQKQSGCRYMVNLVDIDNFKQINDTYGHEYGDIVLTHLSNIFSACIRETDEVGRWGGDEFLFIYKDIAPDQASELVHRLHNAVNSYDWTTVIPTVDTNVSISSGYTTCSGRESKKSILQRADLNLYTAKGNGRNQAVGP